VTLFWLAISALIIASLAAIGAQTLRDFSRSQLRELLEQRELLPRYDEIIDQHQRAALGAESLRVVFSALAAAALAGYLKPEVAAQSFWSDVLLLSAKVVGGVILLWFFILWFPLAVGRTMAESIVARTWPVWRAIGKLAVPAEFGARFIERILSWLSGKHAKPLTEEELEEEIREVVTEGQREGLLEEDAREMIESVIALGEVHVSEIMTPRTDMVSIPIDLDWDEALKAVIASGHTRFPVYNKNRDDVVGILHIKDMLEELARGGRDARRPISELLRKPFFVPESKAVDELLQEFQHGRNHIAVVMDEFGGVSGLVTIEDVLEEIVGEITDEHDEASAEGIKCTSDTICEASAKVRIDELNDRMGLHLPAGEHFDTVGGFVFHQFGRIPHVGEEVTWDGVKIKVLEATRRRINRVAIEVLSIESASQQAEAPGQEAAS
jgi:CBS domain containing-hemolysin-like protein